MTRRSLRPQLNQIRGWVRQGRTDAWIAHQLEVPVQQIQAFKRENGLLPESEGDGELGVDPVEELDLRAEDDAAIAAELDAEEEKRREEEERKAEEKKRKAEEAKRKRAEAAEKRKAAAAAAAAEEGGAGAAEDEEEAPKPRRRARRGGRRKRVAGQVLEGTFDHGEEGYGLWLDPEVQDDPVYAEHWAGHRPVEITIEEDQIVIRRAGSGEDEDEADDG